MTFFNKEKKYAKDLKRQDLYQDLYLVLLFLPNSYSKPLPLYDLIKNYKKGDVTETSISLSSDQFLKRLHSFAAWPTDKSTSVSLAIVPGQLLELNGAKLFSEHEQTKLHFDTLLPKNIIFSVMGDGSIRCGRMLDEGILKINPDYEILSIL